MFNVCIRFQAWNQYLACLRVGGDFSGSPVTWRVAAMHVEWGSPQADLCWTANRYMAADRHSCCGSCLEVADRYGITCNQELVQYFYIFTSLRTHRHKSTTTISFRVFHMYWQVNNYTNTKHQYNYSTKFTVLCRPFVLKFSYNLVFYLC